MPKITPEPEDYVFAQEQHDLASERASGPDAATRLENLALSLQRALLALFGEYEYAIINALPVERAAIEGVFGDTHKLPRYQGELRHGVVASIGGRERKIALSQVHGAGLLLAQREVERLKRYLLNLKYVLFVGIGAGQPQPEAEHKDIRLGDVVISTGVIQYDDVRRVDGRLLLSGNGIPPPGLEFIGAANNLLSSQMVSRGPGALRRVPSWDEYISQAQAFVENSNRPPDATDPYNAARSYLSLNPTRYACCRIRLARVASANTLLRDAEHRNYLCNHHDVACFDMEGAAVALAAHASGMTYVLVRGVSDYADNEKNNVWHGYAAVAAAAVTRALLEDL